MVRRCPTLCRRARYPEVSPRKIGGPAPFGASSLAGSPAASSTPAASGAARATGLDGFGGGGVRGGLTARAASGVGYGKRTDPIPVDWLQVPGVSGKIGMCFAPGKGGPTGASDPRPRDVDLDLDRITKQLHGQVLVPLIEDFEFAKLEIPDLIPKAKARGMHVEHFPIPDMNVPPSMEKTRALAKKIVGWLGEGKNVIIHCRGGWGRTGTIAGCVLAEQGVPADQAIKQVRMARKKTIQTTGQEQFIAKYAAGA
jgi:protein-tyrosine phosphatase